MTAANQFPVFPAPQQRVSKSITDMRVLILVRSIAKAIRAAGDPDPLKMVTASQALTQPSTLAVNQQARLTTDQP